MASLKKLFEKHGAGVWITNAPSIFYGSNPFRITGEHGDHYFDVEYKKGGTGMILKECEETNDYMLYDELLKNQQAVLYES